jgi:pilus assembly protein CpaF
MLQAMNTGHGGSMTTTHADSALSALSRISDLALAAHSNLDHQFVRSQTAEALHYVLQMNRMQDGMRRVTELVKVNGYDSTRHVFEVEHLYRHGSTDVQLFSTKGDCYAQASGGR